MIESKESYKSVSFFHRIGFLVFPILLLIGNLCAQSQKEYIYLDGRLIAVESSDPSSLTIGGVSSSSITTISATISWSTNLPSDSQIEYGLTTSYGNYTTLDSDEVTTHSQTITGLSSNTLYNYRVISKVEGGPPVTSENFTFTTLSTTTLVISNVSSTEITSASALISWSTNLPSDSQIEYGLTTSYGNYTTLNSTEVTTHSQTITGLSSNTFYNYRVISKVEGGTPVTSENFTLTTLPTTSLVISNVFTFDISTMSAGISWNTDLPSDSQVEYGLTTSYGSSSLLSSMMVTTHVRRIYDLSPGKEYNYRVISKINGIPFTSDNFTFTTLSYSEIPTPQSFTASYNPILKSVMLNWFLETYLFNSTQKIERTPGGFRTIDGGQWNQTEYDDVEAGKVYVYRVCVLDELGHEGPWSNLIPVRTSYTFDQDVKADPTVWSPSTGLWNTKLSTNNPEYKYDFWGWPDDKPLLVDFDGDSFTDRVVWRPSTGYWYILKSSAPGSYDAIQWGQEGDIPVPGDYDLDGITDLAIYRPNTGYWYILKSSDPGTFDVIPWGQEGDIPVPGDYDFDYVTDLAVYRPSTGYWYILKSSDPGSYDVIDWGQGGDVPVPADYDGDEKTDVAVWRPSTGYWYILKSSDPGSYDAIPWGQEGDIPVPADYDALYDGGYVGEDVLYPPRYRADVAVWRPSTGTWYIRKHDGTYTEIQLGTSGDIPLAAVPSLLVNQIN